MSTCTGFSLVCFATLSKASSTMRSALSFLPCMPPLVLITLPLVFSPVPPRMSLFVSLSTMLTFCFANCFLACLPNECGTFMGLRETPCLSDMSAISIPSVSYFPKSFMKITNYLLGFSFLFLRSICKSTPFTAITL
ncbi:Uncharacterised protein [uncultured archaeon]|nr:Uncharacterised protein [uncultured archaeon]